MKLLSTLLLASGLAVAMAADSASLRVGDGSRQLDYSSSSSSSSSGTSLSAGTWVWYLMLNAVAAPIDAFGGGCNVGCEMPTCSGTPTSGSHICPERCCVAHVGHPPKPKKKSSGGGGGGGGGSSKNDDTSNNDDNKVVHWGDDGYWAADGHSQWSDDGNYWYDDGAWDDDHWANDGYWYWDDDAHSGTAHWLSNNQGSTTQSSKNKIIYPLVFVGLVVGALAVALVARRVSGA